MRRVLAVLAGLLAAAAFAAPARAAEPVVAFDPASGEFPEGIAFDRAGSMYVGLAPLGEIRRRDPGGSWSTFATIDRGSGAGFAVLGLAAGARGTLYAAAPTDAPDWHGVVAFPRHGAPLRLAGTERIAFPNGMALDRRGNLYVTDSIGGAIWRVGRDRSVTRWLDDETLTGTAVVNPFPLGANGIAYSRGRLYVANTERRHVVEVPILRSGAPGRPRVVHTFPGPADFLDGIAADARGDLFVALPAAGRVARIDRCGTASFVAGPEDGLRMPASLAFGPREHGRGTLYVTNFSLPDFVPVPEPGVVALDTTP